MSRFYPSRLYLFAGFLAVALAAFSAWCGMRWTPAFFPAAVFAGFAAACFYLASRPVIEIQDDYLKIRAHMIPWSRIVRVDRTGWVSPLVVRLTLDTSREIILIYPGDLDSANNLLRHLRRSCREALIDGVPYRQYWGEVALPKAEATYLPEANIEPVLIPPPRYPLLRPEDEAEVERLFQRLKTVGHLDPKGSADEK